MCRIGFPVFFFIQCIVEFCIVKLRLNSSLSFKANFTDYKKKHLANVIILNNLKDSTTRDITNFISAK